MTVVVNDNQLERIQRIVDEGPKIRVAMSGSNTPEENEAAERFAAERKALYDQRIAQDRQARKESSSIRSRPKNMPRPSAMRPWQKDSLVGLVIPNEEFAPLPESGIVIPTAQCAQDRPHACVIVDVSEDVSDTYKYLIQERDRLNSGGTPHMAVMYQMGSGYEHTDPITGQTFVWLHAKFVLGDYDPDDIQ